MECYECAIRGEAVAAVATCRHCGVGLCLEHLAEAQLSIAPAAHSTDARMI